MRVLYGIVAGTAVLVGITLLGLVPLFLVLGPERALVSGSLEFGTL